MKSTMNSPALLHVELTLNHNPASQPAARGSQYCCAKNTKRCEENDQKHSEDVFLFSYINQGITGKPRISQDTSLSCV